jgi:hypothetical protein
MTALAAYVRKGRMTRAVFSGNVLQGAVQDNVGAGLTASTTHTIAGGTPLVVGVNTLGTVANAGDAATLPLMNPGEHTDVYNQGAHIAAIYPNTAAGVLDGGTAGASGNLTNGNRARFTQIDSVNVVSAQLGNVTS